MTETPFPSATDPDEEVLERSSEEEAVKGAADFPSKPWDPKHIRITTKNFTIREVYSQIVEQELDLAPDFQRSFVWKRNQQMRLIESILLGIPLPAFYFNQDNSGAQQVIDGVQRLTTIRLFMSDALELISDDLQYLSALRGLRYSTLDPGTRRRFAATQLVAHVIEPQTPDEVKYDIFNRVNTGGSPLTAQEIRHCMSKQRSRNFLKSLVELRSFDEATTWAFWDFNAEHDRIRDNRRMANREMALRFCAFKNLKFEVYAQASSMDAFLLEYTRQIDDTSAEEEDSTQQRLNRLRADFDCAMKNAFFVLGSGAFRRWSLSAQRRGPINRAVFESQAIALADYQPEVVEPRKQEVGRALRELFDDSAYDDAVRSGTGDPRKLELRLSKAREALKCVLS